MSFFQSSTVQLAEASLTKISFIKKNGVPETVPKIIQTGHCYLKLSKKITTDIFGTQQETKANLQEHGLNLKHLHINSSAADLNSEYTPTLKY